LRRKPPQKTGGLFWLWLASAILISGLNAIPTPEPAINDAPGEIQRVEDIYGAAYLFTPVKNSPKTEIVVLIHGTPAKELSEEETALSYIRLWREFAQNQAVFLLAPVFNQADFSSREGDHALGGYRGLFGRLIPANEWLLRLVRAVQKKYDITDRSFYLYGHSAGGQYAGRFLMTHPEVVKGAVISSAATYPQPYPEVAWPFGLGKLDADILWDAKTTNHVSFQPDKQKWLDATRVPLTVIVGLNDTSELPAYPGQKGKNRFSIAQNWVSDMNQFAKDNGIESRIKIEIIPGKGHSMSQLMPYTQKALISR